MLVEAIHPPMAAPGWWLWAALALLALAVVVLTFGLLRWRRLGRAAPPAPDGLEALRVSTLAAVEAARAAATPADAAQALSRSVRRFAGLAADTEADFSSTAQLELHALAVPALAPVAALVAELEPVAWGGADADVDELADRAREVILQWR